MKAHMAIHVAPDGKKTLLAAGLEGDPVIRAYRDCKEHGKTYLFCAYQPEKSKRYATASTSDSEFEEPAKRRGRPPKSPIE